MISKAEADVELLEAEFAENPVMPSEAAWVGQNRLSGVEFLRSLTAMILTAGWGCKVTTGRLFDLAKAHQLDADQKTTVRSALWLTLVSHPRSVLEYASADDTGHARLLLKVAVQENHLQSGLSLGFLEKIAQTEHASDIQTVAAELLLPNRVSDRHFQAVTTAA